MIAAGRRCPALPGPDPLAVDIPRPTWCTQRTFSAGGLSNQAVFGVMGPGVRPGTSAEHVNLVDVAPTLSRLIGIDPPRDCDGQPIAEALE